MEMMEGAPSVKAAVSSYREKLLQVNPSMDKLQTNSPQKLHLAKSRDIHHAKGSTETATAKSDEYGAKKTLGMEESKLRATAGVWRLEKVEMDEQDDESEWSSEQAYVKVMRELELIKQELNKLKLDMASVLEEKRRADEEQDSSLLRAETILSSAVEKLNREIEEINEKHVLVELARMEAVGECEQVEAEKRVGAERYTVEIEEARKKKQEMAPKIEDAMELEKKLAVTISEVNMLSSKLKQVKEADRGLGRKETWRNKVESDIHEREKSGSVSLLQSVMRKLEAAREELNAVKEESFQFMTSMDIVRDERKQIGDELAKLRNKEKKSEMAIENLKSKLLRAKAKLEATSAAEDKAKSMASNISVTLEQLKSEAEEAKKEQTQISEETAVIKAEIHSTETEMYLAEERLQVAQHDLKLAKATETTALENLKALTEKTMRNRASSSRPSSRITISRFEYEYLIGHAAGAKEIADKKVAAAQAWIEALNASEKEMQIKSEFLRRASRELGVEEEQVTKRSMSLRRMVEDDFAKWRRSMETEQQKPETSLPRKATNRSVRMTPARRGKARTAASPQVRGMPRSTSFTVRRRRKVIPNLATFFSRKSSKRHQ